MDRDAHRKALAASLGDDFVASCASSMSRVQITCALRTNELNAAVACSQRAARP